MFTTLLTRMDYEIEGSESITEAVVRAVSAVKGCPPETLRPLGKVLDPDALETIFDSRGDSAPRLGGRISFIYNGCRITIDNGEYLTIDPITDIYRSTGPPEPRHDDDVEHPPNVG